MTRIVKYHTGITMIELIVTIVILAISLLGVTFAIQGGLTRSSDALLQIRTVALAQAYLDEILGKRFDEKSSPSGVPPCRLVAPLPRQCTIEMDFGPEGETRSGFDDVDDYHALDEGDDPLNPLHDAEGNPRAGYENFRVQITVRYINVGVGEEEGNLKVNDELDDELDAKLITVNISHRTQTAGFYFSAYKVNF